MAKKNITIENLATMIQKEFNEIHPRLVKIDKIDKIEKELAGLKMDHQMMMRRLEGIVFRTEFDKLEIRVMELEDLLAVNHKK